MNNEGTGEVIKRTSIIEMAVVYAEVIAKLEEACKALVEMETRLLTAFDNPTYKLKFHSTLHERFDYHNPGEMMKRLHREAWAVIVDKASIRRVLSDKRRKELDAWLEKGVDAQGQPLPELTAENIFAMLEHNANNLGQYMAEATKEVYDALTPRDRQTGMGGYVTNQKWQLGKRIVLDYALERWSSTWHPNRHREQLLRNLDNIFHLLDGKGTVHTHNGPLVDSIMRTKTSDYAAETVYFKLKLHKNGNLHIEFKRLDLVDQFNLVATGNELKS